MNVPHVLSELGWNRRPLTYADFEALCAALGVEVLLKNVATPGMYFVRERRPFIGLSMRLSGVRLWLTAWHEMTHHLLHAPGLRCFSPSSISKAEAEANRIAVVAALDEETLFRIMARGELHDYPHRVVRERIKIAKSFFV